MKYRKGLNLWGKTCWTMLFILTVFLLTDHVAEEIRGEYSSWRTWFDNGEQDSFCLMEAR